MAAWHEHELDASLAALQAEVLLERELLELGGGQHLPVCGRRGLHGRGGGAVLLFVEQRCGVRVLVERGEELLGDEVRLLLLGLEQLVELVVLLDAEGAVAEPSLCA